MSMNAVPLLLMVLVFRAAAAEWPLGEMVPSTPGGDYVLIDQQLQLVCRLNSSTSYNSGQLFVEKGDNINVSLTIIDDRTAATNLTIRSLQDAGKYYCWLGTEDDDGSLFVGSRMVEVEYKPELVENITCVKNNWDSPLTCTWDLGVRYVNDSNVEVTYLFRTRRSGGTCPNQTKTMCYFSRYNFLKISYAVRVRNKRTNDFVMGGPVSSECNDLVKPDPVNIINISVTKSSYTLFWSHNRPYREKLYRIRFHEKDDPVWKEILRPPDPTLEKEPPSFNWTEMGLRPYTQYEVEIDTRPSLTTGYWSNKIRRTKRTLEDVPATGPHTTRGSFYSEVCHSYVHDVTLFWQEPRPADRNGKITHYLVEYNSINKTLGASEFQFTALSLQCDKHQVIYLNAGTSVGASGNPYAIVIPPTGQGPKIEDFYVMVSGREVKAMWKRPEGEITEMYVYWCVGSWIKKKCEKLLKWGLVEANKTSFLIPDETVIGDDYLFGLSAIFDNLTTGIMWSECTVMEGSLPSVKPSGLQVEKTDSPSSLKIKWPKTRCIDTALITSYRLYVGEVAGQNIINERNFTYNLTTTEHVAGDLHVGTNYSFRLQALSSAGDGPISDPLYQTVASDHGFYDSPLLKAVAGIAGSVGVFFLVVGLICCYWKRKQCWRSETISLPKWTSPYSSPTHDMLRSDTSSSESSSMGATNQTKATEEDVIRSSSSNSTRTSSDTNMNGGQLGILPNETVLQLTSDPDQIQVVIDPNKVDVQNGIVHCPDYKKIGDIEPVHSNRPPENYSLFTDTGPEADQIVTKKDLAVASLNHVSSSLDTTVGNVAQPFHPDYVQEQQVTNGVPYVKTIGTEVDTSFHPDYLSNTSPPVILNENYVPVPLVNACKQETSEGSGSDNSRSTSGSLDAYMKAGLGQNDVQTSPESPTHPDYVACVSIADPAVLPLEEHVLQLMPRIEASPREAPTAGMEANPGYISITDISTKL
ncbi:interleukin-12 receptor subunit beta-2-like isoform X2 [Haliotis asinina]|uniref:interleukin-12 receptor subunit beta-2-like isoform X2 n=1 Tax=Haliotis asinina TaxID=109174 RepID=UPI003531DE6F